MIPFNTPNSMYPDVTISGRSCALSTIESKIYLNFDPTPIDTPLFNDKSEDVLFLRNHIYDDKYYLGGKGHFSGSAWLFDYSRYKWYHFGLTGTNRPVAFFGPYAFICRNNFLIERLNLVTLKIDNQINGLIGVNGIQCITDSGKIISGDSVYDGHLNPKINVAEYTKLYDSNGQDEVIIGQGYNGGCIVVFDNGSQRRVLEPGNCRFINSYRKNLEFAVAISKLSEGKSKTIRFSRSELYSLPLENVIILPPIIIPDPPKDNKVINESVLLTIFSNSYVGLENNDESKRKFILAFCSYVNGIRGNNKLGGKAREGLGEPSKATIGYWINGDGPSSPTDGIMDVFQLVSSSGLVSWDTRAESGDPLYKNIFGRFFPVGSSVVIPPIEEPPVNNTDLEVKVSELENKLNNALTAIKFLVDMTVKVGDQITLQTEKGFYLCPEGNGLAQDLMDPILRQSGNVTASRTKVEEYETLKVGRG